MSDIFISYAREDESRVKGLVSALEQQGWSVFWDRRIPSGETWRSYIGKELDDARCVIVAWSRHSVNSTWVTEEADDAKGRGVLVPVQLDSIEQPRGFREIQAADLTDWQPGRPSPRFDELVQDIGRRLRGAPNLPRDTLSVESSAAQGVREDRILRGSLKTYSKRPIFAVAAVVLLTTLAVGLYFRGPVADYPAATETPARESTLGSKRAESWGVVLGSYKLLEAAREDVVRASRKGIPTAHLYFRNDYYASVVVVDDLATAQRYQEIAKGFSREPYIASMSNWCRNPRQQKDIIECQGGQ